VTFWEKKCPKIPKFPPEFLGVYPAVQSVFCKKHVFSGTDFPNFPKLHKFVPRNFPKFPEFPEISGSRPPRVQKSIVFYTFISDYSRKTQKTPNFPARFSGDFPGIFREFPGFRENTKFPRVVPSGNSGKLN
jgi:hypothetical protein